MPDLLQSSFENYFEKAPNKPAAGNAGIAHRLTISHHRPGVPEPGRSPSTRTRTQPEGRYSYSIVRGP
jgi:hypothetical protein